MRSKNVKAREEGIGSGGECDRLLTGSKKIEGNMEERMWIRVQFPIYMTRGVESGEQKRFEKKYYS